MFERVTGFFRRFRSKRKTSETAVLGPDEGGGDFDDFGFDDDDFGDAIGTDELGTASAETSYDFEGGDAAGEPETLSGVDTFETLAESQEPLSLSGGSGEDLLEDSQPQADTFESLGGDLNALDSGGSDADDFGEDFGDFGGDFEQLEAAGEEVADDFDVGAEAVPAAPAKVSVPLVAGLGIGGLALGAVLGLVVLPMFLGGDDGLPLDQQLAKAQSDLRKAKSGKAKYDKLGGLAAIQKLQTDLEAERQQYATLEDLEAAVGEAREREQAYDAIVQAKRDAEQEQAEAEAERAALASDIAEAEARFASQQNAITDALVDYQRRRRAMEASEVVANAYEAAEQRYARDRVAEMLGASGTAGAAGD